jgi:hypothetical protein
VEFTKAEPRTIPTIAVVEEAQAVLNAEASGSEPYIEWVKEGRKYDLGAVLITQQPGSIPNEILSQWDNWFVFHLLSAGDLQNVRMANAHFSEDLLSTLLNEPIPGQGVFWSSVGGKPYSLGKPYPLSLRILSFEATYAKHKPSYMEPAVQTFAAQLRERFASRLAVARAEAAPGGQLVRADRVPQHRLADAATDRGAGLFDEAEGVDPDSVVHAEGDGRVDVLHLFKGNAIRTLAENEEFKRSIDSQRGIPWG